MKKNPSSSLAGRQAAKRRRRELTPLEAAVLLIIQDRRKEKPVQGQELAITLGSNLRVIRQTVRDLIVNHYKPIGSSTGSENGAGYYWVTDPNEMYREYERLRHRGVEILRRAAALQRISKRMNAGQTNIPLRDRPASN